MVGFGFGYGFLSYLCVGRAGNGMARQRRAGNGKATNSLLTEVVLVLDVEGLEGGREGGLEREGVEGRGFGIRGKEGGRGGGGEGCSCLFRRDASSWGDGIWGSKRSRRRRRRCLLQKQREETAGV